MVTPQTANLPSGPTMEVVTTPQMAVIALYSNIEGDYNTANGQNALYSTMGVPTRQMARMPFIKTLGGVTTPQLVVGLETQIQQVSQNTFIGTAANVGSNNLTNATAIGYGAIVNTSNTIQLGNSLITDVITSGNHYSWSIGYRNDNTCNFCGFRCYFYHSRIT